MEEYVLRPGEKATALIVSRERERQRKKEAVYERVWASFKKVWPYQAVNCQPSGFRILTIVELNARIDRVGV